MTSMTEQNVFPSRLLQRFAVVAGIVLVVGVALTFCPITISGKTTAVSADRVWSCFFVAMFYLATLSLGGTLFVAFSYVSGASWSVAFRRVPEAMAATLPLTGVGLLAILLLRMNEYGWHHHGHGDVGTFWFKEMWSHPPFWAARAVLYVGLWVILSRAINAVSKRQDETGDIRLTFVNKRLSVVFLFVYGVTFTLASCDWLMLLEPMWFSTIWGVYSFSGMIQASLATMIILCLAMSRHGGPLQNVFTTEHLHDLGKLLLGFSCFWMYIWFSQYMLIWYSNIPEETSYFVKRTHGPWGPIMVLNIVLNWGVPFFLLLPKPCKRSQSVMMKIAVVVLIGRAVDLYLAVLPSTSGPPPTFPIWEVASMFFVVGVFGLLFQRAWSSTAAVPRGDPLLGESLHYHG